jgi:hypothetical protein
MIWFLFNRTCDTMGHNYQPVYSRTPVQMIDTDAFGQARKVIVYKERYEGHVCHRCGLTSNRPVRDSLPA